MRALWRNCLAPLVVAIAVLFAGAPAHLAAVAPAQQPSGAITLAYHFCPEGTNWDNVLQACV